MAEKRTDTAVSAISIHEVVASDEKTKVESNGDFTNVNLAATTNKPKRLVLKDPTSPEYANKKNKTPRRTIHFSDGVLEEFSETEDEDEVDAPPPVDPKKLKWVPWFMHYFGKSAKGGLGVADYCGEKLAWFFGITSPKYQYAIEEYKRMKKEEQEEKEREEKEKEFQRRRKAEGGLDVEEGVPTYSNKAFGLEVQEGDSGESSPPAPPQEHGDQQEKLEDQTSKF